jgi:hypothetical protein
MYLYLFLYMSVYLASYLAYQSPIQTHNKPKIWNSLLMPFHKTSNVYSYTYTRQVAEIAESELLLLTHCGRVMQICVFNKVKLGTSASSP